MLVNCVAYQDGRKLADIPIAEISDYVSKPDCFARRVLLSSIVHLQQSRKAEICRLRGPGV